VEGIEQQEPKHQYTTRFGNGIPEALSGLIAEARKCDNWEEFEKDFIVQKKHGTYWHITDNPNFFIDPQKGPRDMSSMAYDHSISKGKLMITSHLDNWAANYPSRKYVAQIDMSMVPRDQYWQSNRGFGNEFWVENPTAARVIRVVPKLTAYAIDKRLHSMLPQSREELIDFWYKAQEL